MEEAREGVGRMERDEGGRGGRKKGRVLLLSCVFCHQVLSLKLKALILDTIHNMDVVDKLLEANVKSADEWLWQKQLR